MTPDMVNGLMELGGAWFSWMNVVKLHKERRIAGIYWPAWAWFALWGIWNLYFYRALDQWFSWVAGMALVLANLVWLALAVRVWVDGRTTR